MNMKLDLTGQKVEDPLTTEADTLYSSRCNLSIFNLISFIRCPWVRLNNHE